MLLKGQIALSLCFQFYNRISCKKLHGFHLLLAQQDLSLSCFEAHCSPELPGTVPDYLNEAQHPSPDVSVKIVRKSSSGVWYSELLSAVLSVNRNISRKLSNDLESAQWIN